MSQSTTNHSLLKGTTSIFNRYKAKILPAIAGTDIAILKQIRWMQSDPFVDTTDRKHFRSLADRLDQSITASICSQLHEYAAEFASTYGFPDPTRLYSDARKQLGWSTPSRMKTDSVLELVPFVSAISNTTNPTVARRFLRNAAWKALDGYGTPHKTWQAHLDHALESINPFTTPRSEDQ